MPVSGWPLNPVHRDPPRDAVLTGISVIDSLTVVGLIPFGGSAEDMERSARAELTRWGPLVKKIGFTAES